MADIKTIVKQMKDAGMSYPDILSNLQELGIADAEKQLAKLIEELEAEDKKGGKKTGGKASGAVRERGEESLRVTKISGADEKDFDIDEMGSGASEANLMKKVSRSSISNADDVEEKLDQIIALLKSLHDVNKKILESNRELMVKIDKKGTGGHPTVEKLF